MGKYLDKFKHGVKKIDQKIMDSSRDTNELGNIKDFERYNEADFQDYEGDEFKDEFSKQGNYNDFGGFNDVGIQPAQKSESFHHYVLENKYRDVERVIRGFKDVYDKDTGEWRTIRKKDHCFTDEEAEEIVRTVQSHLSTDIKLARMSLEAFGKMMELLFEHLESQFYRIAEYRYGRYGDYENQGRMKDMNKNILTQVYNNIWANYSRAIGGSENRATHESVKGQESLQNTDRDLNYNNGKRFGEQRRW
jgi:hypothetical protein